MGSRAKRPKEIAGLILTGSVGICGCCKAARMMRDETVGNYGRVCENCRRLILRPTGGVIPTAFENRRTLIRMARPNSNQL